MFKTSKPVSKLLRPVTTPANAKDAKNTKGRTEQVSANGDIDNVDDIVDSKVMNANIS